jgi:hypothetical protein
VIERHGGKRRQLLVPDGETKMPGIELDGPSHIGDLVAHAVKADCETRAFLFFVGG